MICCVLVHFVVETNRRGNGLRGLKPVLINLFSLKFMTRMIIFPGLLSFFFLKYFIYGECNTTFLFTLCRWFWSGDCYGRYQDQNTNNCWYHELYGTRSIRATLQWKIWYLVTWLHHSWRCYLRLFGCTKLRIWMTWYLFVIIASHFFQSNDTKTLDNRFSIWKKKKKTFLWFDG